MASAAIPQLITAADVTIVARARVSKVLDTLFERNLLLTARPWAVLRLQPFLSQYDKDVKVLHDKGKQASLCQLYSWPESLGPVNEDIRGRFVAAVLRETKKQLKQKGYEIVALQHKPESLTPASSTASERQVGPGSAAADAAAGETLLEVGSADAAAGETLLELGAPPLAKKARLRNSNRVTTWGCRGLICTMTGNASAWPGLLYQSDVNGFYSGSVASGGARASGGRGCIINAEDILSFDSDGNLGNTDSATEKYELPGADLCGPSGMKTACAMSGLRMKAKLPAKKFGTGLVSIG